MKAELEITRKYVDVPKSGSREPVITIKVTPIIDDSAFYEEYDREHHVVGKPGERLGVVFERLMMYLMLDELEERIGNDS